MKTNVPTHLEEQPRWWLYLLACRRDLTYVGVALDVGQRFALHARGRGAKFTRANPPVRVLGAQPFTTRSAALRAEYALKCLTRAQKLEWAAQWPYTHSLPDPS